MQLELVRELIGMFVERIVTKIFPNETGAARLQQVGLFTMIFVLEANGTPITATRLSELTGQSVSQVQKQLQKLADVGVIERKEALNRQGRGRALHLSIKHTRKTKQLLEVLSKAAANRKR
jgi:predicted transcriptional regulator